MMRIDHLAIAAQTLEDGVTWAEEKFGAPFQKGGQHARYGTHNYLMGLEDGIYIEVIAADPTARPEVPRWFGLDDFTGPARLVNWICEPADLDALLRHGMERVPMQRGDLRWDMGVRPDGALPLGGGFPTVLHWDTDAPPGVLLASAGWSLMQLTVFHPDAQSIETDLQGILTDNRVRFRHGDVALQARFRHRSGREIVL